MGCLILRVAGPLAVATAFVATLGAQQPAVTVHKDDITIRGCVREVDLRTTNPSLLVWSRSDLMLVGAEAAGSDAPNPIGTTGFAGRVFYWLDGPLGYALAGSLEREELLRMARQVYEQLNS